MHAASLPAPPLASTQGEEEAAARTAVRLRIYYYQYPRVLSTAEEHVLLSSATRAVARAYRHVRDLATAIGHTNYLPTRGSSQEQHNRLSYIRTLGRKKQLGQADIKLLAYMPRILGPAVFGDVEVCDHGWRWSFALAGVDVHSGVFASEKDALAELALVQKQIHRAWPDPGHLASLLRQFLRRREDVERLATFADARLMSFALPLLGEASDMQGTLRGFPN